MTRAQVLSLLDKVTRPAVVDLLREAQTTLWELEAEEGSEAAEVLDAVESLLSEALDELERDAA
ncbi:hypothetical protein E1287_14210 [Actinomadura sp. KC06]|uniref:hypothetical protein n=1 Tax=Actinomadura sp. KC06 TaxID=2530369 RepID=UPI00104D986D|nr:hypothetical protein [Actinomadura sp. KC06]TDD35261.1 hypothetical protein E1287_14210 [Actinomadura sp. KC06]